MQNQFQTNMMGGQPNPMMMNQQQFMTGMPPMGMGGFGGPGAFATNMNPMMGPGFGAPMGGFPGGFATNSMGGMGGGVPPPLNVPVASGPGPQLLDSFKKDGFNILGK